MENKFGDFAVLAERVKRCDRCVRMAESARILSLSSGGLASKVMFVGEAPGRFGADSTGIPFHGDKAGDNFEALLSFAGIHREDIFVTNAVLCNPKDEKGNNATPTKREIQNCAPYLKAQIDLIKPRIVVTLGAKALEAVSGIEAHALNLRESVRTSNSWYQRILIPLYHPGQRAMLHRSWANQRSDYQFVAEHARRAGLARREITGQTPRRIAQLVRLVLSETGEISYFALHKVIYLIEYGFDRDHGYRLSDSYFIRQKDGPYGTELHVRKLKSAMPEIRIRNVKGTLLLSLPQSDLFVGGHAEPDAFSEWEADYVKEQARTLKKCSDSELKKKAYLSRPMKRILRLEKNLALNLYNTAVFGT